MNTQPNTPNLPPINKPHKIAIIGIGAIANMHARAIADIPNATLVAGSCRTPEKGKTFASDFNCNWYPDTEKMLDEEKPDLVTIATPSALHLEGALAAFKRGIHALVEKPLDITVEKVDRMIDAADSAGLTLGCIFPQRFNPAIQTVHNAAAEGRFGALATAIAYVPWWRDDNYYSPDRWQGTAALDGGGATINQAIHAIDAMQYLAAAAGSDGVAEIFGYSAKRSHNPDHLEVEDTAVATLRFNNGALGLILAATSMYPGTFQRITISGRDGTAEIHEEQIVNFHFREERTSDAHTRDAFAESSASEGGASDPMAIDYANHTANIADFLHAIENNTTPLIDGREARKSVQIVNALYASVRTNQAQKLK